MDAFKTGSDMVFVLLGAILVLAMHAVPAFGVRRGGERDELVAGDVRAGEHPFQQMLDPFLEAEDRGGDLVAHLDEVGQRHLRDRLGVVTPSGLEQWQSPRPGAARVVQAAVEFDHVLEGTVRALSVERHDRVRRVPDEHQVAMEPLLAQHPVKLQPHRRPAQVRRIRHQLVPLQPLGKIEIDVEAMGIDLLSLSAHKIYGPKGVGALYIRKGTPLAPLLYGGHSERDRRPGTENTPGIVGLGKAAELARAKLATDAPRLAALRDRLEKAILADIPLTTRNGDPAHRLPSTSNIRFAHIEGEAFVIAMDLQGVACSTGAACSSGSVEPSHVLSAIGLSHAQARSSIRFSLGRMTTAEDIDYTLKVLPAVVERLRSLSPHSKAVTTGSLPHS